jgi:hypothetical protein
MQRITIKDLEAVCARLNRVTGSPPFTWDQSEDGRHVAAVGNYHISRAYGGFCLHRMSNESGGVSSPLSSGHIPARDLYERMQAYLKGFADAQEAAHV